MFASCVSGYHWRGTPRIQAHAFPLYAFVSNLSHYRRVIMVTFASHQVQTGLRASSVTQPRTSGVRGSATVATSRISIPASSSNVRASSGV
jgi:hypothetical protein